jgi:AraC-like DNA-binding protein
MDPLSGLLDAQRARSAFLLRSVYDAPWALRIEDRCPVSVLTMLRGAAWISPDSGPPIRLEPGRIAVVRGPDAYTVHDDPSTAPQIVIHPGQICRTPDGDEVSAAEFFGVRRWGTHQDGAAELFSGSYESASEVSRRLIGALPPVAVVDGGSPASNLLIAELDRDEPGQQAVLDRALDLVLVTALRDWFASSRSDPPRWYRARSDAVVGPALRLLHENPETPWTVADLASAVGVSRAALARRFTDLVGEPPMTYLTSWRLDLGADLLREPDATVVAVARKLGYSSAFAFSTAFKRARGVSPARYRETAGRREVTGTAG